MKISRLCLLGIALICLSSSLPTSFDLRVQPSKIKYASFALTPEGTCVAHAWGLQLAQIVSNVMSVKMKEKLRLSSQQVLECISSENELCHDASLDNIKAGMKFIETFGLTTEECVPNRLLAVPSPNCPRICRDGYNFPIRVKAKFTKQNSYQNTLTALSGAEPTAALIIVKVSNEMNYYSSEKPQELGAGSGETYEYRVGEIVAWKDKGKTLVVRLGSGQGWGFNGFANIDIEKHSSLIEAIYTVRVPDETASRIQVKSS